MSLSVVNTVLDTCQRSMIDNKDKMVKQIVPCFWGETGVGKSQSVITWAIDHGFLPCLVHVGSMESPADLLGMPDKDPDTKKTTYLLPDWFKFNGKPVLLFFDEMNRGNTLLQQAMFPILLDRMVGPHKIPDNCMMVVACNPASQEFNVNDLDAALINRMWHVAVEPKVEEFISWSEDNLHQDISDFIEFHETSAKVTKHVITLGEKKSKSKKTLLPKVNASPRSWEMFNLAYYPNMSKSTTKLLCEGLFGPGIFEIFYSFTQDKERPLSPPELLTNYPEIRGYVEKWGSVRFNRIDLLDITLQRLARYINRRNKTHKWAYVYVSQFQQGLISTQDYSLVETKHEDKQHNFISLLGDLSSENRRSLQVLLDVNV